MNVDEALAWAMLQDCEDATDQECMNVLAAEVRRLRQGWIPVAERLPEVGVSVLVYFREAWIARLAPNGKFYEDMDDSLIQVSHWMPLPEPPK